MIFKRFSAPSHDALDLSLVSFAFLSEKPRVFSDPSEPVSHQSFPFGRFSPIPFVMTILDCNFTYATRWLRVNEMSFLLSSPVLPSFRHPRFLCDPGVNPQFHLVTTHTRENKFVSTYGLISSQG